MCVVRLTGRPDWAGVLRRAEEAGIWTIPDPSTLANDHGITLDGWTMVVELRDASGYRTYRYSNPHAHPAWPQAAQALAVARSMAAVDSLMSRGDVTRIYRGITPGTYRSEIRLCGTGERWDFYSDLHSLAGHSGLTVPEPRDTAAPSYYVEVLAEPTPEWLARRWDSRFPRVLQVLELKSVQPAAAARCD